MASENNLTAVFTDIANAIRDKKGSVDTIKPINMADEINSIEVGGGISSSVKDFITTRNAKNLFYSCKELTSEQLASILKYDDTSGATNMDSMFQYCSALTTIPQLDTSNVTTMDSMFGDCKALTSIPLLDTSKVTNMGSMFRECLLTTIPLLDTSNVRYMSQMFNRCSKLENIPQLDTGSCLRMSSMFMQCTKLTTIPQLDTSNVTTMDTMFFGCNSLTSIPQLDTSKVTYMYEMFYGCSNLVVIPQLDTSSCSNITSMFLGCSKLEKIDITKFVSSDNNNFACNCYSLKKLVIRTMDTIPTLSSNAFASCYHFYGTTNSYYNPNGDKDGRIYVPDDKVETLKTATNWSVFADIIKPLSEYVE